MCSKLTKKTPERRHWCRSGVFIVNIERISCLVLAFILLACTCRPGKEGKSALLNILC